MNTNPTPDTPTGEAGGSGPSYISLLPITRDIRRVYQLSILIALLTAGASIAGLLFPDAIYPTPELQLSFLANDVVNLLVGLPILLGSMFFARRGSLVGLLFWPGALLYGVYNYLVYSFSMPFTALLLLYLAIVILSVVAIFYLATGIDDAAVKAQLQGRVPERVAGGFLIGFGALFLIRSLSMFAGTLSNNTPISRPELGLLIADAVLSIPWIIGGSLLWRRRARGYVWGAALLFQAAALFVGLILILIIQPALTETPLVLGDVVAIAVMSLVCFIPFGLYTRGIVRSGRAP